MVDNYLNIAKCKLSTFKQGYQIRILLHNTDKFSLYICIYYIYTYHKINIKLKNMTTNDLTFQNVRNNYIRCIVYFLHKIIFM